MVTPETDVEKTQEDRGTERSGKEEEQHRRGRGGGKQNADPEVQPGPVLPAARPPPGVKTRGAGGGTASRSCTGGLEEPACTKLMGNCSVWLLPSLEQGLERESVRGGAEVHEMGGTTGGNAPRKQW